MGAVGNKRRVRRFAHAFICVFVALQLAVFQVPAASLLAHAEEAGAESTQAAQAAQADAAANEASGEDAFPSDAAKDGSSTSSEEPAPAPVPDAEKDADAAVESPTQGSSAADVDEPADTAKGAAKDAPSSSVTAPATRSSASRGVARAAADGTDVELVVQKQLVRADGGTDDALAGFAFTLYALPDDPNAEPVELGTATTDSAGNATFDALHFTQDDLADAAEDADGARTKVFSYQIVESAPERAVAVADPDDPDNAYLFALDDVVYDTHPYAVEVELTDDGAGALSATVQYEHGDAALEATNLKLTAHASIGYQKQYFGNVPFDSFVFSLTALDGEQAAAGSYEPRGGDITDHEADAAAHSYVIDDGVRPITVYSAVASADFSDGLAAGMFPEIRFTADGTYYYLIEETEVNRASATRSIVADKTQFIAAVTVADGAVADTAYTMRYPGEDPVPVEAQDVVFYNNSAVVLSFDNVAAPEYVKEGAYAAVYPLAKKDVNGNTAQLKAGEYSFELLDDAGAVVATAENDEDGDVSFFDDATEPGLTFDEAGVYTYRIREVKGFLPGVTYDSSVVVMTVNVTAEPAETASGDGYQLVADVNYDNPSNSKNTAYAEFHNLKAGTDVKVRKVASDTKQGLAGCTYALQMKSDSGDVMVAKAESDADGWITFTDVSLSAGESYYFKEVKAPAGYWVNPHPSESFTVAADQLGQSTFVAPVTVTDDPTRIEVAKLDEATHEFVKGASLCVIEKDSGAVVDEWMSDASVHATVGLLEAGRVYVLRETEAPTGYTRAADVEFRLNETEGAGFELLSGEDAEKAGDFRIDLYDTATPETDTATPETVVHKKRTQSSASPATSDPFPVIPVVVVAAVALVVVVVARLRKR